MSKIRVVFADDQHLVRAGLDALLKELPGVQWVQSFASGDALLAFVLADPSRVDVIISDIRMPGLSGIALAQSLRQHRIEIPILLLTTFEDPKLFLQARKASVQGFLLKDTQPETLLEAIITLHEGGSLLSPKATQNFSDALSESVNLQSTSDVSLQAREVEVLRLMAGGYANKEIAAAMHLAEGTIKNYVSDILRKLDCDDRTRAVLKAIANKLI
jgi:DNA-binding NarL/FixJ family response regulator